MKPIHFLKARLPELITALLIFLFSYTAVSKFFELPSFRAVLSNAPLLNKHAGFLSFAIPLTELAVVLLLCFSTTRLRGLYCSAALLIVFTIYIAYMIETTPHLPCSCGGVIQQLSWGQHFLFNLFLVLMTFTGITTYKNNKSKFLLQ